MGNVYWLPMKYHILYISEGPIKFYREELCFMGYLLIFSNEKMFCILYDIRQVNYMFNSLVILYLSFSVYIKYFGQLNRGIKDKQLNCFLFHCVVYWKVLDFEDGSRVILLTRCAEPYYETHVFLCEVLLYLQ